MKIASLLIKNITLLLMIAILVLIVIIFRKTMREGLKPQTFIREVCDADCELGCSIRGKCLKKYKNMVKKRMHYINAKGEEQILKYNKNKKSWKKCSNKNCKKYLKDLIENSCCGSFDGNLSHGIGPKKSPSEEIAKNETKMYPDGHGGDWEGVTQCADKMRTTEKRKKINKYAELFEYGDTDHKRLANCSLGTLCQNIYKNLGEKYRFSRPDTKDDTTTEIFEKKNGTWVKCTSGDCEEWKEKGIGSFCCDSLQDLSMKGKDGPSAVTDYYGIEDNLPETKKLYKLPVSGALFGEYMNTNSDAYVNVDTGSKCPKNIPLTFYNDGQF